MHENLYKLFRLQCADLLVLADMEYNGMVYHTEAALAEATRLQEEIDRLVRDFHNLVASDIPSIGSPDDISAVLYGGVVEETVRVPIGHYKTGARKGEVKYKNETVEHTFPRLVDPLKDTETKKNKDGGKETWSVSEDVLLKLKATKEGKKLVKCILEYRQTEKLRGTYLQGWANLIEKCHWDKDMIHGNLNQCVAVTGRLASDKPNLQNANKAVKKFLGSRYD